MYYELKRQYWWYGMKSDVTMFVSRCPICQMVKAEHQHPIEELRPLEIPEWKWDNVGMDFITRLLQSREDRDGMWVVIG